MSLELRIANMDYRDAYQQALIEIEKYPDAFSLKSLTLELAYILGESDMLNKLLEGVSRMGYCLRDQRDHRSRGGETALRFGAGSFIGPTVVSRCLESMPQSMRCARAASTVVGVATGNQEDAEVLIGHVLGEWRMEAQREKRTGKFQPALAG